MRITGVTLTVSDVPAAVTFFTEVLELSAIFAGSTAEVTVGRSILLLSEGPPSAGVHHLAFDIPSDGFEVHRDWLAARVPLLSSAEGVTEFEGPPMWNSRSVYFEGPDRMVLELIARRERPRTTSHVPEYISLSEVGLAVPDVAAATASVEQALNARVLGSASDEFAPVGDHDGLLILVRPGRGWLPVFDVESQQLPVQVDVAPSDGEAGLGRSIPLTDLAIVRVT